MKKIKSKGFYHTYDTLLGIEINVCIGDTVFLKQSKNNYLSELDIDLDRDSYTDIFNHVVESSNGMLYKYQKCFLLCVNTDFRRNTKEITNTLSHECFHAIQGIYENLNMSISYENEELGAYLIGNLFSDILDRYLLYLDINKKKGQTKKAKQS